MARLQFAANITLHIAAYTVCSYRVIRGRTGELEYA